MDTPDNYYAILGVPIDADSETLKRTYRQLARRYHPDLAGPEGAVQMKRINRAYDVLSDPEKRLNYDTIIGGVIDFRRGGLTRPRPHPHPNMQHQRVNLTEESEFTGLSIFSTKGPLRLGPVLRTSLGVISAVSSIETDQGLLIGVGTLDGKGLLWHSGTAEATTHFAADATLTVESLRELRFSANGQMLAGWGREGLHVWDAHDGTLLWSQALRERAVSAHFSLDVSLLERPDGKEEVMMALPFLSEDALAPRALGVRGSDVVGLSVDRTLVKPAIMLEKPLVCAEEEMEKRQFWAIRLRALARDAQTLLTLSCAHVPGETGEMAIVRRWD